MRLFHCRIFGRGTRKYSQTLAVLLFCLRAPPTTTCFAAGNVRFLRERPPETANKAHYFYAGRRAQNHRSEIHECQISLPLGFLGNRANDYYSHVG